MKILSATVETEEGHEPVSKEQIEKDYPQIKKAHDEKCKSDATWPFFGGIITIEGRKYQVAP